jgi:hypothetical protein
MRLVDTSAELQKPQTVFRSHRLEKPVGRLVLESGTFYDLELPRDLASWTKGETSSECNCQEQLLIEVGIGTGPLATFCRAKSVALTAFKRAQGRPYWKMGFPDIVIRMFEAVLLVHNIEIKST